MTFRSAYSGHVRSTSDPVGQTLTEQAHKKACDTNNIVRRYLKTGMVDHLNPRTPIDGMMDPGMDFKTAMDIVARGNSAFESQPAALRAQFDHDPKKFVEFCTNPDNADKLVEMGLANAPVGSPEPIPAPEAESPTE